MNQNFLCVLRALCVKYFLQKFESSNKFFHAEGAEDAEFLNYSNYSFIRFLRHLRADVEGEIFGEFDKGIGGRAAAADGG